MPGKLGTYSALMGMKPSTYRFIDIGNELRPSQEGSEDLSTSAYFNYREQKELLNESKETSLSLDLKITTFFILTNLVYYLFFELLLNASLGKFICKGRIVNKAGENITISLKVLRSILFFIFMALSVGVRFLCDTNYYVVIAVFFLIIDIPILFKSQSLIDLISDTYIRRRDKLKK